MTLADGVVRVCDTNFGAGNSVKWYGYVNKKLWLKDDSLSSAKCWREAAPKQ